MASASINQQALSDQFYNFPPFFTLQPTPETRKRQLDLWTKLIQEHCKESTQFILTRTEDLFTNGDIKRTLHNEFITELFNHMIANQTAIPYRQGEAPASPSTSKGPSSSKSTKVVESVIVLFIPKEKWYEKLYGYAKRNGLVGGIATMYEILNDPEFTGMDGHVLEVLLREMQRDQRNCEVIDGIAPGSPADGVKFF